jgi:hypothetical protein
MGLRGIGGCLKSPNGVECVRPANFTVGSDERETSCQSRCSDEPVGGILGVGSGQSQSLHAHARCNRQDDEPALNFVQKRLQADLKMDATLAHQNGQFHQGYSRYGQAFSPTTYLVDRGLGIAG